MSQARRRARLQLRTYVKSFAGLSISAVALQVAASGGLARKAEQTHPGATAGANQAGGAVVRGEVPEDSLERVRRAAEHPAR